MEPCPSSDQKLGGSSGPPASPTQPVSLHQLLSALFPGQLQKGGREWALSSQETFP